MTTKEQSIKWALSGCALLVIIVLARHLVSEKTSEPLQPPPAKRTALEGRTARVSRSTRPDPTPVKQKTAAPRLPSRVLDPESSGAIILSGQVFGEQNSPVKGALVAALTPPSDGAQESQLLGSAKTDVAGRYQFGIAAQPSELLARATEEHSAPDEFLVQVPTRSTTGSDTIRLTANFLLVEGRDLTGSVMDSKYKPIAGAEIQLVNYMNLNRSLRDPDRKVVTRATRSGQDGIFTLVGAPLGATVRVSAPNHVPASVKVDNLEKLLLVKLDDAGAAIEGHVYRLESNEPLAGAKVQLVPETNGELALDEASVTSAADGSFRFDEVPRGQYSFAAEKGNLHLCFDEGVAPAAVDAGSETTQPVSLFLYEGRILSGRVTDAVTKRPIEGVEVKLLQEPGRGATTDASGFYRMENAYTTYPFGWMAAIIRKSGYIAARGSRSEGGLDNAPPFEIVQLDGNKKESSWDFEMSPVVNVSGRVVRLGDDPVAGAKVEALHHSLEPETQFSDRHGQFDFLGVAGDYAILQADCPGIGMGYSRPIKVGDGNSTQVKIVLRETVKVTGHVLDEGGAPIQEAQVSWVGSEPGSQNTGESSLDGSFTFDSVPSVKVNFTANKRHFLPSPEVVVDFSAGAGASDIKLVLGNPHTLHGTVKDESGAPISQASIYHSSPPYSNAFSDEAGVFSLNNVPGKIDRVVVYHSSHLMVRLDDVSADEELHVVMKTKPTTSNTTNTR